MHLHRLEELEYLLVHRGGRGQSFVYELLFERQGEDGQARAARPDRCGKARELQLRRKERGAQRGERGPNAAPSGGIRGVRGARPSQ